MRKCRRVALLLLAVLGAAFAACGDSPGAQSQGRSPQLSATRTVVAGLATDTPRAPAPTVALTKVASGFTRPTFVTNAGDGSGRLFVVEKAGTIRVVRDGAIESTPFADLKSVIESDGNEQGLLGLAFHPRFEENGRLFVAYTGKDEANTVAELRTCQFAGAQPGPTCSGRPTAADPTTLRVLLAIADTRPNHNGGMLGFGPDGYLYISTGDGGGGGDPDRNGQSLAALLGKILRVDVDAPAPYGIPPGNPFVHAPGARGEIWAYGLRNPWRFSFDRETGDLWIGDVGQNAVEEVDFQPAASKGGENYGWNIVEGTRCHQPAQGCTKTGITMPAFEYSQDSGGCSVTGGYVYRGTGIPALTGRYLFTDYCRRSLLSLRREGQGFVMEQVGETNGGVSSFGEDEAGELYLLGDSDGTLYRLSPGR